MEAAADALSAGRRLMGSAGQAIDLSVGALVDQLVQAGVRHFCACPGSRSTPLAIKLAQHPSVRLWMHLDERSAAYFALGMARAGRAPVGLVATSGTAAANFLPAIVEAFYARVPLVVLTADRPHELRDCGAPQTIDQVGLYGKHVRWFFDLAEPDAELDRRRHVRSLAARAVATATAEPAGPVHLNCPYREPLLPEPADDRLGPSDRVVSVASGRRAPAADVTARLARELSDEPRGLIVCGPQDDPDLPEALAGLARRLGYPLLADPLSGVRCGPHDRALVLDAYDASLRDLDLATALAPRVVLRFGATPTSKSLLLYLERLAGARYVLVDGGGGWNEPSHLASDVLHVDGALLARALSQALPERRPAAWLDEWLTVDRATRRALNEYLAGVHEPFEGKVFAELAGLLPNGATLYAGNSMPVRDLDAFFPAGPARVRLLSNRGANGIDGVVSSALGASAVSTPSGPTVLAIGDISFYHDLNGLLAARQHRLDLTVVLLNNDGGGIFSFLPQATVEPFETLFGTPHGLDFRPFVEGYGGDFVRVERWPEFRSVLAERIGWPGLHVVEVPTDRQRNVALHRAAWRSVPAASRLAPVG